MNCRTEIFSKVVQFGGGCGIITSDIKFAGANFAVQRHGLRNTASLRTFYHQILLSDDKRRRTAVSVYTDLIYGIIISDMSFCR